MLERERQPPGRRLLWLVLFLGTGVAAAGDWPQWGGPNRDFTVAVAGLADRWPGGGPRRLWRRPLGAGHAAVVTRGDLVFVMHRDGGDEVTSGLSAASGETVWQRRDPATPRPDHAARFGLGPNATPAVAGDVLVTLGYTGILQGLDAASGEPRWRHDLLADFAGELLRFGYAASPLLHRDRVIVLTGGERQGVAAFDPKTGAVVWRSPPLYVSYASPIAIDVGGREQIVFLSAEEVFGPEGTDFAAVDLLTGKVAWSAERFRKARPIHAGGKLILLDEDGWLVLARVSPEKLEVVSEIRLFEGQSSTVPTLAGTTLLVRDQREVVALDLGGFPGL